MTERLLTRSEVAARWRVSEKTVDRRRADGSLQGTLIGGVWRYSLADVEACEQRGREAWIGRELRSSTGNGCSFLSDAPRVSTNAAGAPVAPQRDVIERLPALEIELLPDWARKWPTTICN